MCCCVTATIYVRGNLPLTIAGREIGIYPPLNILQIAYVVGFVRLMLWWRKQGRGVVAGLDVRLQQLVRWHFWPLACWLVLPKHFGYFLFYNSPGNAASDQHASLSHGLAEYASWAVTDYHVAARSRSCRGRLAGHRTAGCSATAARQRRGSRFVPAGGGPGRDAPQPQAAHNLHSWIAAEAG